MHGRILLPVKRFKQYLAECSVASASSIAYFYDKTLTYNKVRKIADSILPYEFHHEGLYTSQQATLLNTLGFAKVTIVTSDPAYDFGWNKLKKPTLIHRLRKLRAYHKNKGNLDIVEDVSCLIKWLSQKKYDNSLVIDSDLHKHIKRHLKFGRPVLATIHWTKMFKFSKGSLAYDQDIKGEPQEHSLIVRGYDSKGVFIVDSHYQCYVGSRQKYKNGFYKLSWDKFCTNMSSDIVLV